MIGYYAHSHGSGHCNYANIFARIFDENITILTDRDYSFQKTTHVVKLSNEDPDGNEYKRDRFPEPRALHYAPINLSKITRRNKTILETVLERNISLLIVDVSVEIAMLARVSSVPYAYVRLQGRREDIPHLNAYEGATFLLAYFPEEMESVDTPPWIREKTIYLGFLSKFMFRQHSMPRPLEYYSYERPILLYLSGYGGSCPLDFKGLEERFDIYAIGPGTSTYDNIPTVKPIGVVKDTAPYIKHADIIVAACGSNTISEVLSLGKTFVAIPEKRHYSEQNCMAANLERMGWAVDASRFQNLLEATIAIDSLNLSLPKITVTKLNAFRSALEFYEYRSDELIDGFRKKFDLVNLQLRTSMGTDLKIESYGSL